MPVPAITPYPMPLDLDPPAGGPSWRPDPRRAALLIHDMQRYFTRALPAGTSPTTALLTNIARVRDAAGAHGMPVLYSAQPGGATRTERGLLHDLWGPGLRAVPEDRDIEPSLAPRAGDTVIHKTRWSAFHRTGLAAALARAGRDQLIVCGVFAHLGCLFTAADAFTHDVEPFLLTDAVADFTPDEHRAALTFAARRFAVVLDTATLLTRLHDQGVPDAARTAPGTP
ncbi:bifunctional isochorismate lyase/aryl carrier protein [Catenuloplanes nepalensis]|uniref:Bifunctional isochorismate lyase/aryl carrier protein n=1 Tax=Catenuloplanes nepalensis TaxID=587533 RepID=A0ABT9MYE7_9ACTN|nr:isochorismatase family protein [Catenuloplanes nepalensis]MDP9796410.1 bifunctional isochorismate lyase/aryl carrier protein [Catenuloplanes nepalensis]